MLLDTIYKNLVSAAEPAITKKRMFFYFITIIFCSPLHEKLFAPIIFNDSLINATKTIGSVLESSTLLTYISAAIAIFYFLPYFHFYICLLISRFQIRKAGKLIELNVTLSKKSNSELKAIIIDSYDAFRLESESATAEIKSLIDYSESLTISVVIYLFFSFKNDFFCILIGGIIFVVWWWLIVESQQRISIAYMKRVMPYKILSDRYQLAFEDDKNDDIQNQ